GTIRVILGGHMRITLAFAAVSLGIVLTAGTVQAHHSLSATYDGNKPITLRGTIVKMGWQNPHAHLYVDVKNADGKVVTWEVESGRAAADGALRGARERSAGIRLRRLQARWQQGERAGPRGHHGERRSEARRPEPGHHLPPLVLLARWRRRGGVQGNLESWR